MDQQGAEDTPAAIYDAPTPNPWLQYQSDPVFWNHFSLFLPFFQQAGHQFPTPAAASPGTAPIVWPGVPLQPQNSALQNPLHPMPALQSIGTFRGMPLFTPIEGGQQQPLATAAAIANGTIPSSSTSPTLLTPTKLDAPQRTSRKKRARILREGQLTMIVYGANEALTWARRVAQFQSVMRNVLGDRRKTFTWSGSVTDSVVGAFLTQNVSDALSSRAYMEVASRWPARHNATPSSSENTALTLGDEADTVDWESVRTASISDLADAIRCRGMQMVLSNNIQSFLNHLRRYNLLKKGVRVAANGGFRGIETDILATMDAMLDRIVENVEEEERNELDSVMANVIDGVEVEVEYGLNNHRSPASRSRSHVSLEYEQDTSTSSRNLAAAPSQSSFEHDLSMPSEQQQQQQEREKTLEAARLLSSEWLRDAPDDEARDFLMSINGLGRKSVACIMLLTLGKNEFPVDTNVGRICSRLGWIPLDAAESIEELDDYAPEPEVHAYLRSRLLGFDVETLYELHYQMITLGKVFCSKQNPNCTACPMQKECEYALQNGPSLHGRKKIKIKGTAAFGDGTTAAATMAAATMNLTSNGNIGNANRGVHWRTQQKIDRLAQEKAARELALADHARLYSTLDLEDLVLKRTTWPRSKGLRRPHGMNLEDAAVSQLQRAEEELRFKFKVTQWEENHPKFLNWFNLDTLELGRQGLLPASVWDTAVAMDVIQDTQKEISEEMIMLLNDDGRGRGVGEVAGSDGSSLTLKERISAWEQALRDAPKTLQYPTKAVTSSTIESSGGNCLSIWELAPNPPPPRHFIQQQQEQQRQPLIGMEPPRPPVLLKSKPVVVDQGDTGGDKEVLAAEANGGAAAVIDLTAPTATAAVVDAMDLDESPIDFVPPEGTTEVDLMDASIAELLPELMSWMPPSPSLSPALPLAGPVSVPVSVPLAVATAAAATPGILEEEEEIQKVNKPTLLPGTTIPPPLLSSASNIELECCRLQQLAIELAAENEIILKLEQGADVSTHRKRLLELSLQALNFDLSISVDSAESVVTAARINYRQLARALHPDKCKLAGAADAFSGLSMAMRIVSEYSLEKEQEEKDSSKESNSEQQQPFQNLAARAPGGAEESRKKTLEHRIVWNQSRLVVSAHILPSHIHSTFSHLQGATLGAAAHDEDEQQVMFLPMSNIPTFHREELAGRRTRTTAIGAHDGGGGDVEVVMDGLLNAVCGEEEAEMLVDVVTADSPNAVEKEKKGEDTLVEGMLLVTCRAALRGRFPLNGTYFQINELFADHQTAVEAVELPQSVLETTKTCAIYFGLGIHYMSKAMSQAEVAMMFSDGWVCFRAFDPETRAPMLLPHFLMPSVPTATTSTWKNKTERAAIKAAKMAARNGLATAGYTNLTSLDGSSPHLQQQWNSNNNNLGTDGNNSLLAAAPKRKYKAKKNHGIVDGRFDPMFSPSAARPPKGPGHPMTQEAMDAKSGKGKPRRRTFGPIIKSSQKCGRCKPCLNPGWKKPCDVRRAEMLEKLQQEQNERHEQEKQQQQQQQVVVEQSAAAMVPPPPLPVPPPTVSVIESPIFTPTPDVYE